MRKLYRLLFHRFAEQDIYEIVQHLEEIASAGIASGWSARIRRHMEQLRSFPKGYSYFTNVNYRRMIHGKYLIVFRIDEENHLILVCRIFHGNRLQENIGPLEDEP